MRIRFEVIWSEAHVARCNVKTSGYTFDESQKAFWMDLRKQWLKSKAATSVEVIELKGK